MSQSVCLRRVGTGWWAVGMNRSGERSRTVAGGNSESGLLEVMVERQGCRQASLLHDHERDAVGQGVAFVGSLLETVPALGEQGFGDVHQVYEVARAQPLPDVHGFRVLVAAVEERDRLIEHVTGGHNALHLRERLLPVPARPFMVLVAGQRKRNKIPVSRKTCLSTVSLCRTGSGRGSPRRP